MVYLIVSACLSSNRGTRILGLCGAWLFPFDMDSPSSTVIARADYAPFSTLDVAPGRPLFAILVGFLLWPFITKVLIAGPYPRQGRVFFVNELVEPIARLLVFAPFILVWFVFIVVVLLLSCILRHLLLVESGVNFLLLGDLFWLVVN